MQLGMVGLGRMGANMVRRLMKDGHEGVVFDMSREAVEELAGEQRLILLCGTGFRRFILRSFLLRRFFIRHVCSFLH